MSKVALKVNGREYEGWTDVSIVRTIEAVAGAFRVSASERRAGNQLPWPINPGDECTVLVDGFPVLVGHVEEQGVSYRAEDHSVSFSGRELTGDLVDCSVFGATSQYMNVPIRNILIEICAAFGIPVRVDFGIELPPPQFAFSLNPGESAFEAIDRLCRLAGVLPISDGMGALRITKIGSERALTPLVEGANIRDAEMRRDQKGLFNRYIVTGQHPGSDQFYGSGAASVYAEARDRSIRESRQIVIRGEAIMYPAIAQKRAEWESAVRAARAGQVKVTVQGWKQQSGQLWPVNGIVQVKAPRLGIDGPMLITEAQFGANDREGETTQLRLMRPDAYLPEPEVPADADPWGIADQTR